MGKIYKTLMFDEEISVSLLDTTDIVNTAIEHFNLSPVATATLGRALTVVAFMSSNLKNENDSVTVTISGDGAGGHVVVCADSKMNVRGYIDNPAVDLPLKPNGKLDVGACVGKGRITVVKNLGLKKPYTGSCHIVSGEIAEDFCAYYTYSEQQPTAIALGVKVGKDHKCIGSGGLVLQPMPGAKEENIVKAEELLSHFNEISTLIETIGMDGIKEKYFSGVKFNEYDTAYKCNCSRDRIDRMLITLGEKELYETIEQEGKIEVTCHFCSKRYVYKREDVDKLLNKNE